MVRIYILFAFAILFSFFSFAHEDVLYRIEGCYREDGPDFRWCKDSSSMFLNVEESTTYRLFIYLLPLQNIQFTITVNGEDFTFVTEKGRPEIFAQTLELNQGTNTIEISSDKECGQLNELFFTEENSIDIRCASFAIFDKPVAIPIDELYKENVVSIGTSGWYAQEQDDNDVNFQWMSDEALMELYSSTKKIIQVSFYARKFEYIDKNLLRIFRDGELIFDEEITKNWLLHITKPFLLEDHSSLKFDIGQCLYPHVLGISSDPRCLGIAIGNFTIIDLTEFVKILPKNGLYPNESDDVLNSTFRWSKESSEFSIYSPEDMDVKFTFHAKSITEGTVELACNQEKTRFNVTSTWNKIELRCDLKKGENVLRFTAAPCISPKELNLSQDERCLSFAITDILVE